MTRTYQAIVDADLRREVLELLDADPDFAAPAPIIKAGLSAVGRVVSEDKLRTELAWLAEQGFVELQLEPVLMVKLTVRGSDIVANALIAHGVARRLPE
jgi:hypothetical protein